MNNELPKWVKWVAMGPVFLIACVAVIGIAVSAWAALGWWSLIVVPGGMLWFICFLNVIAHADRKPWR